MFIPDQENTGSLPKTVKMFLDREFTSNNVKKRDVPGLWQDVAPIFQLL